MPDYTASSTQLGTDWCPTSSQWDSVLSAFAAKLFITIPSINGFIAQASTPAASDQDKLWIKTSASAPYVLGAFVYQGGAWRTVPGQPIYFVDSSGAANTITVTTGESLNSAALVTGRLFLIRVANTVTGATAVVLDSLGSKALKKANDSDVASGNIEANQLILIAYDPIGDVFELITTLQETPTTMKAFVARQTKAAGTNGQQVFSGSAAITDVELNSFTDPGTSGASLASNTITLPAGSWLLDISVPVFRNGGNSHIQVVLWDQTAGAAVTSARVDVTSGADYGHARLVWPLVLAASNDYRVRVQADAVYADCYLGGANTTSVGGYGEVYTQVSGIKLA